MKYIVIIIVIRMQLTGILVYIHVLAINIDNITLPNGTVPSDRVNPNAIIVELPTTDQQFRYYVHTKNF